MLVACAKSSFFTAVERSLLLVRAKSSLVMAVAAVAAAAAAVVVVVVVVEKGSLVVRLALELTFFACRLERLLEFVHKIRSHFESSLCIKTRIVYWKEELSHRK